MAGVIRAGPGTRFVDAAQPFRQRNPASTDRFAVGGCQASIPFLAARESFDAQHCVRLILWPRGVFDADQSSPGIAVHEHLIVPASAVAGQRLFPGDSVPLSVLREDGLGKPSPNRGAKRNGRFRLSRSSNFSVSPVSRVARYSSAARLASS
jgi:hypothetical protein